MRRGLVSEVINFFTTNDAYKPEMRKAFLQFRKKELLYDNNFKEELPDEEMKLFIDWFLFNFKLKNGKTPIKTFYLTNYLDFKDDDKENYKNLLRTTYSFWRICKVDLNKGMELLNIFNNKKIYVQENLGTKGALVGDIIINRIGKIDDHYELLGPNDWDWLDIDDKHPLIQTISKYKKVDSKLVRDLVKQFLRTYKQMKSGGIEKINKKLVNKDECICAECHKQGKVGGLIFDQLTGDPILFCKDCAAKREKYYKKNNL